MTAGGVPFYEVSAERIIRKIIRTNRMESIGIFMLVKRVKRQNRYAQLSNLPYLRFQIICGSIELTYKRMIPLRISQIKTVF